MEVVEKTDGEVVALLWSDFSFILPLSKKLLPNGISFTNKSSKKSANFFHDGTRKDSSGGSMCQEMFFLEGGLDSLSLSKRHHTEKDGMYEWDRIVTVAIKQADSHKIAPIGNTVL